jgi:hypothetical protein
MNVTPPQRAELEGYLKQVSAWKLVLGENAERFVVGDRIMGVPCSALALEALTDFIYPDCPVGHNDYTDANHVMIMRAFERALIKPKINKSLAAVLRLMRAEPKWAAAERGKKLANLEPLQNKASVEQFGKAAKDAIRPGPTKRNRKRFLVCLVFSYLYERNGRLPIQRETLDYINEERTNRDPLLALSSLQTAAKYLGLKFGHATYNTASQKRLDRETLVKAARASLK